jgi:hypothetical protein
MQKYHIVLILGPATGPVQANRTVLQLPIIETRAEVLLGLARVDGCITFDKDNPVNLSSAVQWKRIASS